MSHVRPVFGFDGANPGSAERFLPVAPDRYLVRPFYETPAVNYRFRLDLRLEVLTERARVRLDVDWKDDQHRPLRSAMCHKALNTQDPWRVATAIEDQGEGPLSFRLELERGVHHVTLNPKFDHEDLRDLVRDCQGKARVRVLERSMSGLDAKLTAFHLFSGGGPKPCVLAVARLHPYETAGSHCLAGLVQWAAGDGPGQDELLSRHDWLVVPMVSTPGVTQGFCQFNGTSQVGLDLSRQASPSDPVCAAILDVLQGCQLCGYMDIHNWMHREVDGVYALSRAHTWRFMSSMTDRRPAPRPWRTEHRHFFFGRQPRGLMALIRQRGGKVLCCGLEYSWHRRSPADMAKLGVASANAFKMILETSWF